MLTLRGRDTQASGPWRSGSGERASERDVRDGERNGLLNEGAPQRVQYLFPRG